MKGIQGIALLSFIGLIYAQNGCFTNDCTFQGKQYEEGRKLDIKSSCFELVCIRNKWKFVKIDDACDRCHLQDDPHFSSFDINRFEFHSLCNYSLVQPIDCQVDPSYNPKYAVYADFETCNKEASCLHSSTYKIDEHTVVTINHKTLIPNTLKINGLTFGPLPETPSEVSNCQGIQYPAIVWKSGKCAYIVGGELSIKACFYDLFIYTKRTNAKKLAGLCGYYSKKPEDDFVPRGKCVAIPIPFPAFAKSWRTKIQSDVKCNIPNTESEMYLKAIEVEKSCDKEKFYGVCKEKVLAGHVDCIKHLDEIHKQRIQGAIDNCVLDCCANPAANTTWVANAGIMANILCETKLMEQGIIP